MVNFTQNILKRRGFLNKLAKTVHGYHLVNSVPIKEAVWESILVTSLANSGIKHSWNNGGHQSGTDVSIIDGVKEVGISCKSCKDTTKQSHLQISSYRMTKYKHVEDIINCIDIERANFEYYGILSRLENDKFVKYSIHFIPSQMVKASRLHWSEKLDTETGKVSSWVTNEVDGVQMNVVKSMSNQLWIKLKKEMFKEHCVLEGLEITKGENIDYALLYDMMHEKLQV